MKRLTTISLVFALAVFSLFLAPTPAARAVAPLTPVLFLNGSVVLGASPVIVDGTTLVPFRAIAELTGATVTWDAPRQMAVATLGGKTITLPIGTPTAYVNGQAQPLPVAAALMDGRTFVPLRFIAESFGLTVQWNEENAFILLENAAGTGSSKVILDIMKGLYSDAAPVREALGKSFVDIYTGETLQLVSLQKAKVFSGGAELEFRKQNGQMVEGSLYLGTLYDGLYLMRAETYAQWAALKEQPVWAWTANAYQWPDGVGNLEKVRVAQVELNGNMVKPLKLTFESAAGPQSIEIPVRSRKTDPWIEPDDMANYMFTTDPHQLYPDWSDRAWNAISREQVYIGMTEKQAWLAWGPYERRNNTSSSNGTWSQWVYKGSNYLYFENGVLDSIQN